MVFNSAYCFERYVYPAKRDMYDGSEYVIPQRGEDEPWFYATTESYSDRASQSYTLMKDAMKVQKGESKRQDKLESKVDPGFAY